MTHTIAAAAVVVLLMSSAAMASNHPASGDSSYDNQNSIGTGYGNDDTTNTSEQRWQSWASQNQGWSSTGYSSYTQEATSGDTTYRGD